MQLTLGQAAKQVGVSKPTLSKAISTGKLSTTRREDGSFAIDPAELCRYVEANGHRFHLATGNGSRLETPPDYDYLPFARGVGLSRRRSRVRAGQLAAARFDTAPSKNSGTSANFGPIAWPRSKRDLDAAHGDSASRCLPS
jgi:excisionase family DNA binding protein